MGQVLDTKRDARTLLSIRINEIYRMENLSIDERKKQINEEEDLFYDPLFQKGDTVEIPLTIKRRWKKELKWKA